MKPCNLVGGYQCSGEITASIVDDENVGSKFLLDVANHPHGNTVSQPRTPQLNLAVTNEICDCCTSLGGFTGGPTGQRIAVSVLHSELESYQLPQWFSNCGARPPGGGRRA
jgi:hypothetical protein